MNWEEKITINWYDRISSDIYGQKYYSWFNNWIILTAEVALRMTWIVLNGPDLIPSFQFNTERLFTVPLQNSIVLVGVFTNGLLGEQEILDIN